MTIHKLIAERGTPEQGALAVGLNFHHEIHGFADTILKARASSSVPPAGVPRRPRPATCRTFNDVDEALLRPGRCHASVTTRLLNRAEAAALIRRLGNDIPVDPLLTGLFANGVRGVSVADVYRACGTVRRAD